MFCTAPAHAIGDSGGCGDWTGGPLGKALKGGSVADVERELLAWVAYAEKSQGILAKVLTTESKRKEWRKQRLRELVEGVHEKGAVCRPGPLVPVALRAGNVEVVRYLIGTPAGVNPRLPPRILFSCEHDYSEDEDLRNRRRKTFELILQTKQVDVHELEEGWTILQRCTEPELLTLFVDHGARLDVVSTRTGQPYNLLDLAVLATVDTDENGVMAKRLHAMERAKLFARLITNSIEGRPIEQRIRWSCNLQIDGKRWNPASCKALSGFVRASSGTFGENQ
jgi:hypothetical protein